MNKSVVISLLFLILIGVGVSIVKYEVVFLRKKLNTIEKEIETCNDDLKVLGAEWSYLNDPKRLKTLCEKYLKTMKPIENNQIMSYDKVIGQDYEEHLKGDTLGDFIDNVLGSENRVAKSRGAGH